jgi:hypothetical protein
LIPEYKLSESYTEIARLMRTRKANGSEIEGYKKKDRESHPVPVTGGLGGVF